MLYQSPLIIRVPREKNFFGYMAELDSMGVESTPLMMQLIRRTGNQSMYQHAHEWCCGHGAMGFELKFQNICHKLTLTDCVWEASLNCHFVRAANQLEDLCQIYIIEAIEDIPMPEDKWDLIVANPPYAPDGCWYEAMGISITGHKAVQDIDPDWKAHKNFFQQAQNYTTPDCDIYIFGSTVWMDQQIDLAKNYQFRLIDVYDDLSTIAQQVRVMHFRPPK